MKFPNLIQVTKEQVELKQKLGVSWKLALDMGLHILEQDDAMAKEYEKKLEWQKENNR